MYRCFFFFFFNDTATTEIYTLSLHDALPIYAGSAGVAVVLLQRTDDRAGPLSGARHFHPAHEDEEHSALDAGRGLDHASGTGVLRLGMLDFGFWIFAKPLPGSGVRPPPRRDGSSG